jgi:hypothetical protein
MEDYDAGFMAGEASKEPDNTETLAWQRGWAEAQNYASLLCTNTKGSSVLFFHNLKDMSQASAEKRRR